MWKFILLIIVLALPLLFVWWVKSLAEFSYSLDITNLGKEIIIQKNENKNFEPVDIKTNHDFFKTLVRIDLPFFYRVEAKNDLFIYLEATQPTSTPAKTLVILDNKIEIPYQEKRPISEKTLQFKDNEEVKNYLLSHAIKILPKPDNSGEILVGHNQDFRLKADETHKYIVFKFKLDCVLTLILYLFALSAIYPIFLLPLSRLWKFVSKGEPFV